MSNKVFVAMSGGVDSSIAVALLKRQGYAVTGVYMKNWSKDLPGHHCPWQDDYQDAKRVAIQLGIDFKMYDFQTEYKQRVVDYMIEEYEAGRTPNPDITCNQEIKFKLFLETAILDGADLIATGHYSRVVDGKLFAGIDNSKDQSYFLYRVSKAALKRSLLPIGDYTKVEIRQLARKLKLATADKKDSQGICFVGKVGIKQFLSQYTSPAPGLVIDQNEQVIGEHDGALFYTIGQRQGLNIGGGLPYYVVGKNMVKNEIHVSTNLQDERLWLKQITLKDWHWLGEHEPNHPGYQLELRARYRSPLVTIKAISKAKAGAWLVDLDDDVRAITAGQSAVIYSNGQVLGGGIVV